MISTDTTNLGLQISDYLLVNDEILGVTNFTKSSIEITRGQQGSTTATHPPGFVQKAYGPTTVNTTFLTLSAEALDTATSIETAGYSVLSAGTYIQIGEEVLYVRNADSSTVTVESANITSRANHTASEAIYIVSNPTNLTSSIDNVTTTVPVGSITGFLPINNRLTPAC